MLREGKSARLVKRAPEEEKAFGELQLLTSKPALYVCNVDEASAATGNAMTKLVEDYAKQHNAAVIVISAEIEMSRRYMAARMPVPLPIARTAAR